MKPIGEPYERPLLLGLWALPVFSALLFVGTLTHQPPPQTDIAGWSRYVTTAEFLASHLVASILGAAIGILGMIALGLALAAAGRVGAGLWGMVTGVVGLTLNTALFGIAAWAQPAIGRFYLAGHHADAQALYYDAAQSVTLVLTGLVGSLLFVASIVVFGIAVARAGVVPRAVGIVLAVSGPLFLVGAILDDVIESVASALMIVCTVWIALRFWRGVRASGPAPTGQRWRTR